MADTFTYEIKERIAVLSQSSKGWTKEFNLVSWNEKDPKYDIREWSPDGNKMGKGITLTDEDDIPSALTRLRDLYPNLMKLDYDNKRTRTDRQVGIADDVDSKTPIKLFEELYELQNNQPMSEEQRSYVNTLIEKIWEGSL